jgi:hypothetical protein
LKRAGQVLQAVAGVVKAAVKLPPELGPLSLVYGFWALHARTTEQILATVLRGEAAYAGSLAAEQQLGN